MGTAISVWVFVSDILTFEEPAPHIWLTWLTDHCTSWCPCISQCYATSKQNAYINVKWYIFFKGIRWFQTMFKKTRRHFFYKIVETICHGTVRELNFSCHIILQSISPIDPSMSQYGTKSTPQTSFNSRLVAWHGMLPGSLPNHNSCSLGRARRWSNSHRTHKSGRRMLHLQCVITQYESFI